MFVESDGDFDVEWNIFDIFIRKMWSLLCYIVFDLLRQCGKNHG